jgi:alkanesulfonate monooxygenase SsuD/methylene tetrahydromethanopterin reductase-like flavin-dependent oxidoreductase (luciferase family)
MKFGAHYLPTYMPDLDGPVTQLYPRMFEQMEELERLGFDRIWVTEHHFGDYGGSLPHPPTFLSALACKTSRIRLGVAVSVLPLHDPVDLAESYGMVDVISNGRLDFGLGKGSEPIEYRRFGVSQAEATQRMREATAILRQAWSDEALHFRGEFFHYDNLRALPKPVQRPHPPIWVGATRTEETFRWAGENGFNLMTIPFVQRTTDVLRGLVKVYREALAGAGHDFATREVLAKFHIYVSDSLERALHEAAPYMQNYSAAHAAADPDRKLGQHDVPSDMARGFIIAGDPERCIDTIHRWREEAGVTTFSRYVPFRRHAARVGSQKHSIICRPRDAGALKVLGRSVLDRLRPLWLRWRLRLFAQRLFGGGKNR